MASPSHGSIPAQLVPASNIKSVVAANVATLTSVFNETSVAKQNSALEKNIGADGNKYHTERGQIPASQTVIK